MGLTKAQLRKLDTGKVKRMQTLFRLYTDDRRRILKKLINDDLRLQSLMETLCLAYMHGDKRIMEILRENAVKGRRNNGGRRSWGIEKEEPVPKDDVLKILEQLAKESPLKDKDIPFQP